MITRAHDPAVLGAYLLGALDGSEGRAVEDHLAGCEQCRLDVADLAAMTATLGEVPPEALLDGPPEAADVLLDRTLREVGRQRGSQLRRRRLLAGMGAAAALLGVLGVLAGGVAVGRSGGPPTPAPQASAQVTGARSGTAADPITGYRMGVTVRPAPGGVSLHVRVTGLPAGQDCALVVRTAAGRAQEVSSWTVSDRNEGSTLEVSAGWSVTEITAVAVRDAHDGRTLVTVRL